MSNPDVIVIGAGVVGVATALELAERGASVTVIERGPAPAAGCSAGNAGIVGASDVLPLASPDAVREGLRWMLQRHGAFGVGRAPGVVPWLARFLRASSAGRYQAATEVLAGLATESAELHRTLAERFDTGRAERGFLSVYESSTALEAAIRQAPPELEILDGDGALARSPQIARRPAGAVFCAADAHCDPERFVRTLAAAAVERGVTLRTGVEVLGLRRRADGRVSLSTTAGDLAAAEIVLAAGVWSPGLTASLPLTVPIQGGKGYHIDFEPASDDTQVPVYYPEHRIVATPMGERLRISGMLQLTGTNLRVDAGRVEAIRGHARRLLRGLERRPVQRIWRGLRPCTPDGLPMIGRVPGVANLTLATGHGSWGLQLSPVTARLVADVLVGAPDAARLRPIRPDRFTACVAGSRRGGRS